MSSMMRRLPAGVLVSGFALAASASVEAQVVRAWGYNFNGQCDAPSDIGPVIAIAGGGFHTVALQSGGIVRCWGLNDYGACNVPSDLGAISAIAAGNYHTIALRSDGIVRCWGYNGYGESDVPSDLGSVVAIDAGGFHTIALHSNGTVRCWGYNGYGQTDVPKDIGPATAIAGGDVHTIALRTDGVVRCWGHNLHGQSDVPSDIGPVIAIAGGGYHTIALRGDGSVRCWGADSHGQCRVPADLGPVGAIAGGMDHTIALRLDGTVRCWGNSGLGQCEVPSGLGPVSAVSGGFLHTLALTCGAPVIDRASGNLGPIGAGTPRQFIFSGLPVAASTATLRVRVRSDLNLSSEFLTLRLDGVLAGTLFVTGASDCPTTPDEATVAIPLKALGGYIADGALTVRLEASPLVSVTQCSDGLCEISLTYERAPIDCNGDGLDDGCEVRIPGNDCNANGVPDECDISAGASADVNRDGTPDECEYDCNGNNLPDAYEIAQGLAPDCNGNTQVDSCDVAQGLAPDCNGNGVPDSCDQASGTSPDCNANGVPDSCDIAGGSAADIDGNGVPDSCQGDCNGNAIPDAYEFLLAPWKDCDADLVLDSCEIAADRTLDCTRNGRLDSCDIETANGDCNGNGLPDSCEIADGAQDKDMDGVLDDCEFAWGDFDLDGEIGAADLATVLGLWGLQNPPIGDLNGDGVVDAIDLATILSNWGLALWEPSVSSVTPPSGISLGGTTVTIRGSGFDDATTVTIGGAAATVVAIPDATTLIVLTPAGEVGAQDVVVHGSTGSATAVRAFEYREVIVPVWATLIEAEPDPAVVYDETLRSAITATGYAWRVRDTQTQIEMLLIPPGTFNMGCSASNQYSCFSSEIPVHSITLTNAFYMGRYEVTQAQWTAQMGSNPSWYQSASTEVTTTQVPNRPVEFVSWNMIADAGGFLSGTGLRLPTEAEWEYACRAGTTAAFHGWPAQPDGTNDDAQVGAIAWFNSNSAGHTRPVGQKAGNGFGLHDMSGNVWEWVNDWWSSTYYTASPSTNPPGPSSGASRVLRGGSWGNYSYFLRTSARHLASNPDDLGFNIGFRVARNP